MSDEKNNVTLTKEIRDLLNKIEEKIFDGEYIYRGEPKIYDEVSSNLYRKYKGKIEAEHFNIEVVHDEIAREAGGYTSLKDEFDIMAELQHFGGKTNLIDFTKDYRIAIFFACNGFPKKDGRLIFSKRNIKTEEYEIHEPRNPQNRVIAQKSIFIRPFKGWIIPQEEDVILIPAKIKNNILNYLNKCHAISTATVYNDLHGFIKHRETHNSVYTLFFRGLTSQKKSIQEPEKEETHLNNAISYYDKAIKLNPQIIEAYDNRGNAKIVLGDYHGAIADHDKAIEINPQSSNTYNNRGNAKRSLGYNPEAISDYDKAIKLNPQFPEAYIGRGLVKSQLGDYRGAIADYDKSIELNPQSDGTYTNRGNAKTNLGDYHGAIADYDKAIEINPYYEKPYSNRGNAKNSIADHRGAIADCDKAIEINPQYANAYNIRGHAKRKLHDPTAKQDIERAISLAKAQGKSAILTMAQRFLDELKTRKYPSTGD